MLLTGVYIPFLSPYGKGVVSIGGRQGQRSEGVFTSCSYSSNTVGGLGSSGPEMWMNSFSFFFSRFFFSFLPCSKPLKSYETSGPNSDVARNVQHASTHGSQLPHCGHFLAVSVHSIAFSCRKMLLHHPLGLHRLCHTKSHMATRVMQEHQLSRDSGRLLTLRPAARRSRSSSSSSCLGMRRESRAGTLSGLGSGSCTRTSHPSKLTCSQALITHVASQICIHT